MIMGDPQRYPMRTFNENGLLASSETRMHAASSTAAYGMRMLLITFNYKYRHRHACGTEYLLSACDWSPLLRSLESNIMSL